MLERAFAAVCSLLSSCFILLLWWHCCGFFFWCQMVFAEITGLGESLVNSLCDVPFLGLCVDEVCAAGALWCLWSSLVEAFVHRTDSYQRIQLHLLLKRLKPTWASPSLFPVCDSLSRITDLLGTIFTTFGALEYGNHPGYEQRADRADNSRAPLCSATEWLGHVN